MGHVCPYAAAEDTAEAATGFCLQFQAVGLDHSFVTSSKFCSALDNLYILLFFFLP